VPRIAIEAFDAMGAFAAVHESESGTFRTWRSGLEMSAIGGNPEDICSH
jgi:hypothetical protein